MRRAGAPFKNRSAPATAARAAEHPGPAVSRDCRRRGPETRGVDAEFPAGSHAAEDQSSFARDLGRFGKVSWRTRLRVTELCPSGSSPRAEMGFVARRLDSRSIASLRGIVASRADGI